MFVSSKDALGAFLEFIIDHCRPALVSFIYYLIHLVSAACFVKSHLRPKRCKSLAQFVDGLVGTSFEAWQILLRLGQHLYKNHYFFIVLMNGLEP